MDEMTDSFVSITESLSTSTNKKDFIEKYKNVPEIDIQFDGPGIQSLQNVVEQNLPIDFDQKMDLFRTDPKEFIEVFN